MHTAAALDFFLPAAIPARVEPLGQGNINQTWRIELNNGTRLVLQRLHPAVFPDPRPVMANLRVVTGHLGRAGADAAFFRLVTSPEGRDYWLDPGGACWRLLTHIEESRTLTSLDNPVQADQIGRLLGRFHLLVAPIPLESMADPLPDFHVTPRYLEQFDSQCAHLPPRSEEEALCRIVIEEARPLTDILERARDQLTCQVIHGDPKCANFLFAADSDQAISLIDFDTVKPGLLLHDLGDCLRSACNPRGEAPARPGDAEFNPELFSALLQGYLEEAGHLLGAADRALLVEAVKLISFELGLRFFTDHLLGDRYFRVTRPGDNLHRALVQFHLHRQIAARQEQLEEQLAHLIDSQRDLAF